MKWATGVRHPGKIEMADLLTELEVHGSPTQSFLKQHALRAAYQGGYVWGQALQGDPTLPSPSYWGWKRKRNYGSPWEPTWTTIAQLMAAFFFKLLIRALIMLISNLKSVLLHSLSQKM